MPNWCSYNTEKLDIMAIIQRGSNKMYHPYRKDSSYLRAAVFTSYKEKCFYCGRMIQPRDMHIDHVIPSAMKEYHDNDIKQYLFELKESGFIVDSIENYIPSCPACNISKSNRIYTAASLRFFHEQARTHTDEILKKIEISKVGTKEFFYEPVDTEIWEELHFSHQHNISYAIMGYRLTPADVEACPRFPQVERIKNQLEIVDYVIVQGETGCGKSISVYQAAYDLYQKNWMVYRYKATKSLSVPVIPCNTERSLYIIDDAQRLSEKTIETIAEQARPNTKVLFAKTISSVIQPDTILLTNKDAVKVLYDSLLARREEITPIVHRCDKQVGINSLDLPIERRLKEASKAKTPWQFNYILRGGWRTMKEQYQTICSHHDCDLLAAAIAMFQIVQLDNSVNYQWLCDCLHCFDDSLSWNRDDLQYLIGLKIVLSEDDVRIVHMESAAVIIAQFLQNSSAEKRKVLYAVLEASFIEKKIAPLGLVWLCNRLLGYSVGYHCEESFISEKMISFALGSLDDIQTSRERVGIAFFIEKVFTFNCEKNGQWYFEKNEALFLDWVAHTDSETAYAYSRLINTLINTDKKQHRKFVRKVDWTQTIQSMMHERRPNLYAWGELLNRLTYSTPSKELLSIAKIIYPVVEDIYSRTNILNIEDVSEFLCSIIHIDSVHVHETVRRLKQVYKEYFKKDMNRAIHLFDFDFFMYICGISLLGGHRVTKEEHKTAASLVDALPESEFAATISSNYPRYWQRIHEIMSLVGRYDRKKAKRIIASVDTNKLSCVAKDCWHLPYEITHICAVLYIGDPKTARRFVEENWDKIQVMYSPLVMIAPQCAINVFKKGIPVDLVTWHRWGINLQALRELMRIDAAIAKEIIRVNVPAIIKQLGSISAEDFSDSTCTDFLLLLQAFDLSIFEKIVAELDITKIEDNWEKSYKNPRKKKQEETRYHQFLNLVRR